MSNPATQRPESTELHEWEYWWILVIFKGVDQRDPAWEIFVRNCREYLHGWNDTMTWLLHREQRVHQAFPGMMPIPVCGHPDDEPRRLQVEEAVRTSVRKALRVAKREWGWQGYNILPDQVLSTLNKLHP